MSWNSFDGHARSAQESADSLTQARLKERLDYDPKTGIFTYRTSRGSTKPGAMAGTINTRGAMVLCIDYKLYYAHRLAWLYMKGRWPHPGVDHQDGNPLNNKWSNLREANQSQNGANQRKRYQPTSSKYKGVTFDRSRNLWLAQINVRRKHIYLGRFSAEQEAANAYAHAAKVYFGEFARIR